MTQRVVLAVGDNDGNEPVGQLVHETVISLEHGMHLFDGTVDGGTATGCRQIGYFLEQVGFVCIIFYIHLKRVYKTCFCQFRAQYVNVASINTPSFRGQISIQLLQHLHLVKTNASDSCCPVCRYNRMTWLILDSGASSSS